MNKVELMEVVENMVEIIGETEFLEELLLAMSSKELEENLEYINRMNELNIKMEKVGN